MWVLKSSGFLFFMHRFSITEAKKINKNILGFSISKRGKTNLFSFRIIIMMMMIKNQKSPKQKRTAYKLPVFPLSEQVDKAIIHIRDELLT